MGARTPYQNKIYHVITRENMRSGGVCDALTVEQVEWISKQIPRRADGTADMTIAQFMAACLDDAMAEEEDPGAAGNPRLSLSTAPARQASGAFLDGAT